MTGNGHVAFFHSHTFTETFRNTHVHNTRSHTQAHIDTQTHNHTNTQTLRNMHAHAHIHTTQTHTSNTQAHTDTQTQRTHRHTHINTHMHSQRHCEYNSHAQYAHNTSSQVAFFLPPGFLRKPVQREPKAKHFSEPPKHSPAPVLPKGPPLSLAMCSLMPPGVLSGSQQFTVLSPVSLSPAAPWCPAW